MQIRIEPGDGVLVITPLDARLDSGVAAEFRATLVEQLDAGHRRLLVDLRHVQFIDSSGLGALVSALKRLGRDGDLRVCSPSAGVRAMLELTRINRVIPITDPLTA